MSIVVNVNGESINYPQTGDTNWGDEATDFAVQTSSALAKVGLSTGTTVDLPGTLDVTGNTTLDANLLVGGTTSLTGNVTLTNNLTVSGNETVAGTLGVTGDVAINTNKFNVTALSGNTTIAGTLGVTGDVAINTNKFNITASSGNTTIAGTLGISDGTASAPAITPSGDTNTGLYSIGADKIGFAANGVRQGEFGVGYGGFTGNVIQHVVASYSTQVTATTNVFKSTGFSCSITPKYANSKILIIYMIGGAFGSSSGGSGFKLYRNGSELSGSYEDMHAYGSIGSFIDIGAKYTGFYLDSPGVTTSTSYQLYFNARNNTGTMYVQYSNSNSHIICLEIQQ